MYWRVLNPHFTGKQMSEITAELCNAALEAATVARGLSNATHRRYRAFITGVFSTARQKWTKLPPAPPIASFTSPEPEPRPLDADEERRLMAELPLHLQRAARFSLACGARESNVTGLHWWAHRFDDAGNLRAHVSADLRTLHIPAAKAKAGKTLAIPLNEAAQAVLAEARDCPIHGTVEMVFTRAGYFISHASTMSWYSAMKRAGIKGFKWHGLRATWASRHVQQGTPMEVLQKLGGWATDAVLKKHYVKLSPELIARYVENGGAA